MAHQVESMAFFGQLPWHGLGTALDEADLYDWHSACRKAGLDWQAERVPLLTADKQEPVARYAVRRTSDAFRWFQPFLDAREAALHTAGSLVQGARIWVLARLNRDPLVIAEGDEVQKFILLSHSHDGSLAVRVGFTPVRVVCANTLAMAHGSDASKLIRIRHSKSVHDNLENIREVMNLANQEFEATAEQYRLLATKDINQIDLRKYVRRVFKLGENVEVGSRMRNILSEIAGLTEAGIGNDIPSIRGTWWAAYNGLSEYLTHRHGRSESNRLNSLWFGSNANVNRHALDTAVEMALAA
jgi:phage/plasmid-like protein (TIGR03299 family)